MAIEMGSGTNSDMNITPLIDVLLVLIIIFLLLMQRQVLLANLAANGPASRAITEHIVLELRDDGSYAINAQPVSHAELAAKLHEVFALRLDKLLFIKTGPDRRYEETIEMMDVAKGAGVEVVALAP